MKNHLFYQSIIVTSIKRFSLGVFCQKLFSRVYVHLKLYVASWNMYSSKTCILLRGHERRRRNKSMLRSALKKNRSFIVRSERRKSVRSNVATYIHIRDAQKERDLREQCIQACIKPATLRPSKRRRRRPNDSSAYQFNPGKRDSVVNPIIARLTR